ncbi:four helix bundle protein [Catalinimonas alkaloidigena]|uniref:Four helix bundle protein n=2 Tax=Catalinimonas alkaloidigena TaxID=1075417 RepID=A0A1G9AAH3_9BACT|nr:four helix bundle protein [Catalinimonas alkaloidigena]
MKMMSEGRLEFIEQVKQRTKALALNVIRFTQQLPKTMEADVIKRQLLKSATSVAANYRAACRARSGAEFHAKASIVIEEADETLFWLELLAESDITTEARIADLKKEATEILAIMATARKNSRR